jgi:signal peptidase I
MSDEYFESIAQEMLQMGCAIRFEAHGGSMTPTINHNDVITVAPIDSFSIELGDILFIVSSNNELMVHRVIKIIFDETGLKFITKGDSLSVPDKQISVEQVLGKVTTIERYQCAL